jgi:uncharacterized membrane protein YhhN
MGWLSGDTARGTAGGIAQASVHQSAMMHAMTALRIATAPLLAGAALVSAALAMLSAPLDSAWLNFVFKPLTTLLIIAYAWPRGRTKALARRWVLAGLGLSLCGDVALLWPQQGFLPGLLSFLLAHLCYLAAFTRGGVRLAARWLPFVGYALLAGALLWRLWPGVPSALRVPVLLYVVCLASMAAQAAVLGLLARGTAQQSGAARLALGGLLFVASDALLAVNRFAVPLPYAGVWILASYWLAQWCIASWLQATHMPLNRPV